MKSILLLSAAYLNGGAYIDAGNAVRVGDGGGEMTAERAADMVTAKLAEELSDEESADAVDAANGEAGGDTVPPQPVARPAARAK